MPGGFSSGFSSGFDVYSFEITTTTIPHIHYNVVYSNQLYATESNAVWSLESGVLPSGITLSAEGIIAGVSIDSSGVFPVEIKASSSLTSFTDTEPFTINFYGIGSTMTGWSRFRSVYNFRLFGGIYG